MNVLVLGSTGMLGTGVCLSLAKDRDINVIKTSRNFYANENCIKFDAYKNDIDAFFKIFVNDVDYILNCIGVIKPFINKNLEESIYINSLFPHILSRKCLERNIKLIHITTDCVFSGSRGNYVESDEHDALDVYGKSKSLGEPKSCMVLRTSIIGMEKYNKASLISWIFSNKGNKVNGFVNHFWNGITTEQYGKACLYIMKNNLYKEGTFHVFSPKIVTKYELINMISKRFDLSLDVNPVQDKCYINRSLASNYDLCSMLKIPEIKEQIYEMSSI